MVRFARVVLSLLLVRCMPDFGALDAASSGGGSNGGAGAGVAAAGAAGAAGAGGSSGAAGCALEVAGDLAYTFDMGSLAGKFGGDWAPYPEGSLALNDTSVDWSESEGHGCPGALRMRVPFDTYGEQKAAALIEFTADWSAPTVYTVLHGWVKIEVPPDASRLEHLRGVQLSVASGPNFEAFRRHYVEAGSFADGGWQELMVPLEPLAPPPLLDAYIPESVTQIAVQVVTVAEAPPAGPAAPIPTTLFIDDIWLAHD